MQMMFSGDWRPSVWPAVQVHSLLPRGGGRDGGCSSVWQVVRPDAGCSVGMSEGEVGELRGRNDSF